MTDPKFLLEIPHCIARQLDEDLGIDLMASDPPRSGESLQVSWWIGASACSPCPSPSAMRRSKPETRRSAAAAYEPERRRSPGAAVQEPMRAQQKKIKEEIRLPAAAREPQNIARAESSIYKASTLQILFLMGLVCNQLNATFRVSIRQN